MTRKELESLGFTFEQLISKINIHNDLPFVYNGIETIVSYKGKYILTIDCNSIERFIQNIKELRVLY